MSEIEVKLSNDEALVLFEFLSRFSEEGRLDIEHKAEEQALWNLQTCFEKVLSEPFSENYSELLNEARKKLEHE